MPVYTYYELENSISERNSSITGRYTTYDAAREDMKNHCNWWEEKDSGNIYKVSIFEEEDTIKIVREKIFSKHGYV